MGAVGFDFAGPERIAVLQAFLGGAFKCTASSEAPNPCPPWSLQSRNQQPHREAEFTRRAESRAPPQNHAAGACASAGAPARPNPYRVSSSGLECSSAYSPPLYFFLSPKISDQGCSSQESFLDPLKA